MPYKQKTDANNETEYEEYPVTYDMPSYYNVFKRGRKLLNILEILYEQACMTYPKEEYYMKILETLFNYNDHNNRPLCNEKIQQAVRKVMEESEEEERDAKHNSNHVTMDTISPFHHCTISPSQGEIANMTSNYYTISPSQGYIASVTSEGQNSSDILTETINGFKELTI